jgi:anti-sigma28 factor (negative regulator of flagellin synthesis)
MGSAKEIWKPITIDGKAPAVPYVISNQGRFGVVVDGKVEVRKFKPTAGNYRYNTRQKGKNKAIFLYKEVAKAFLKKPSRKHKFIIHKDHNYLNDHVDNLKWATHEEHRAHTTMSPRSILARSRKAITKSRHSKILNEKSVAELKKQIWNPDRKLSYKQLAEKFGVSEMQIYRIKTGEFWYHVHVDNEPINPKYTRNLHNISFQQKNRSREEVKKARARAARENIFKRNTAKRDKNLDEQRKEKKNGKTLRARRIREKSSPQKTVTSGSKIKLVDMSARASNPRSKRTIPARTRGKKAVTAK